MVRVAVRARRVSALVAISFFSLLFANPALAADVPNWTHGTGAMVQHAPVPWPNEPAPASCGADCGDWKPYTRFNRSLNDPRVQDPSNGGTAPQNYVNVSSSCTDKAQPSIYYYLKKGSDPSQDVIMFRWRVETIANNYGTGTNPGSYGATDPWSSALWTVLFDMTGSGYRSLAAHINGSSGSPSAPVDLLAGIYGKIPTQSIDYINDPANIKRLGWNPTAFVDGPDDGNTGHLINFHNGDSAPDGTWTTGATVWDYGTTRAIQVSTRPCTEYFVDYQIPVAMLDATGEGGPKIDRSTPISMLFCTANSLNNPFQKDCALNKGWTADANQPGPFGDYVSFDQEKPYQQPIIGAVTAEAPPSCAQDYTLKATVQDTLAVVNGAVTPSVKAVNFWYYYDANGDGISNDGGLWKHATDATLVPGTMNQWRAAWSGKTLPKGRYLIGVQAIDDNTLVDDGMTPTGIDNHTFSYVTSNAMGEVYLNGSGWQIDTANFPGHSPALSPVATENWYGNPAITGVQVATAGVDLAINACGVAPTLTKSADSDMVGAGGTITYTLTVANPGSNPASITLTQLQDTLPAGFTFTAVTGGSLSPSSSSGTTGTITWNFSPAVTIAPGASKDLVFTATAPLVTGTYTNTATAATDFGTISSNALQTGVGAPRLTVGITPDTTSTVPGGTITYTITYSNDSPVNATGVTLVDTLPTGLTYVPASCTGGCSYDGALHKLTWSPGDLASGEGPYTVTFQATVDNPYGGAVTNQDSVTAQGTNTGAATATASIYVATPVPLLTLRQTADKTVVDPANGALGNQVIFTLTYANEGNAPASNVVLSDPLPAGFTFVTATGSPSAAPGVGSNGTVIWNIGTLAAGASNTVTVTAQISGSYLTGGYANPATNTATLTATGLSVSSDVKVGALQGTQACNTYYFQSTTGNVGSAGTQKLATTTAPGGAVTDIAFAATTTPQEVVRFYQDPAAGSEVSFSGNITTNFYVTKSNRPLYLDAYVYDYNPTNGATTQLGTASFTESSARTNFLETFTVGLSGTLAAGHRILWVFNASSNNSTTMDFLFGGTASPSNASFCTTTPVNMTLSKSVSAGAVQVTGTGRTLTYTLNYANASGGTDATSAMLTDTLPAGTTFASASDGGSHSGGTVTWNLGTVAKGASGTRTVTVNVDDDLTGKSSLVNSASLVTAQTVAVTASATTAVTGTDNAAGTPNVVVLASADKTLLKVGDTVTYALNVVNVGDKTATSVAVSDVMPVESWYTYVPGSVTGTGGSYNGATHTLDWPVGSLAPGASTTLTFQMVVADSGVPDGVTTLNDSASVTWSNGGAGSASSNTVVVSVSTNPDLAFTLSASSPIAPATTFAPGDLIEYTLTVTNDGSGSASGVVVYDPIPANTGFSSITAPGVGSAAFDAVNNQVVFNAGTLAAGHSALLKFKVRVGALSSGTTPIIDTAAVTATNAAGRSAQVSVNAVAAPDMSLTKTGPASFPLPAATLSVVAGSSKSLTLSGTTLLELGDWLRINGTLTQVTAIAGRVVTVTNAVSASSGAAVYRAGVYNITYLNSGNATAQNVVIKDVLPAGLLYVAASPAPDLSPAQGSAGAVEWDISSVAAGESGTVQVIAVPTGSGSITNNATLTFGGDITPCAHCTPSVTSQVGGLLVTKSTSTGTLSAGGIASYTITLTNSLGSDVNNVTVTDTLPSGFSYRSGTGTPAPDSVTGGQPTWTGITVPANGSYTISFSADVAAGAGSATYQNSVNVTAPGGVGITDWDPLTSIGEDVTLLASGSFVIDGYIFKDANANGARDGSDPSLEGIAVEINDDPLNTPYVVYTDSTGYFRQTVDAGTWTISVQGGEPNATLLSGLRLLETYVATPRASAARTVQFGYISSATPPASHALTGTVFHDLNGNGGQDAGESGSNAGGLNVVLVDAGGSVIAVAVVAADGSWNASVPSAAGYTAYITTESPAIGALSTPASAVPAGWSITDSNGGVRAVDATGDRTGLDFAIHLLKPDVYAAIRLPAQVAGSGTLHVLLTFGNQGDLTADGITYKITGLPIGLAGVTCGGASCAYDADKGELILSGLPGSLSAGQAAQVFVTFTAPASDAVSPRATITTTTGGDPSDNNSATATTTIGSALAEVTTTITTPAVANSGEAVAATISFVNLGSAEATGVSYAVAEGDTLALSNGATACTWDGVTHAVSGCVPATLGAGEVVRLTAGFTAPLSGSVSIHSTVGAANDDDGANNTAAGATRVVTSADADLTVTITTATHAGSAATVASEIVFTNLGPAAASAISYTLGFTGADAASVTDVSCTGATCVAGGGGTVTITGLPASLNPGETVAITLTWTGPAAGTAGLAASIATTGTESNTANNDAAATTVFVASDYTIAASATPVAGGSVSGAGTYHSGDTVTLTATANAGYSFTKWTEGAADVPATATYSFTASANRTLVANFTADTFTVSFASNGGSAVPAVTAIASGDTIAEPAAPTRDGYTFAGWYQDPGLSAAWNFAVDTVTSDITLYAKWTVAAGYTVSFDSQGGSAVAAITGVAAGHTVSAPAAPTRTGHTFAGWYRDAALTTAWDFAHDTVTGDVTLYAGWNVSSYSVSFVLGSHGTRTGGGGLAQTVNYGDGATAPSVAAESGWSFSGWDKDFSNVTSNLIVTARYVHLAQLSKVLTTGTTVSLPVTGNVTLTQFSSLRGGVFTDYPAPTAADYGSLLAKNADGTWSFTAYQSGRYRFTFVDPVTGDTTVVIYTIYPNASFATPAQTVSNGDVATVRVLLDDLPLDAAATLPYGVTNAVLGTAPAPADLFTRNPKTLDFDTAAPAVICSSNSGCYMDLQFTAAADSGSVVFTLNKESGLAGARLGAITTHTVKIVPPGSAPLQADLELDPGHVVVVGHAPMVATVTELPLAAGRHFRFDWSGSDGDLGIGAVNSSSVNFTAPATVGVYQIRVTVTDLDFPGRAPIHLHTWLRTIAAGSEAAECNSDCDTDETRIPAGDQDPVCALGAADPVAIPYRLQVGEVTGFDNTGLCLETSPGYGLRLGTVSFVAAPNYGAGVDNHAVKAYGRNGEPPVSAADAGFSHLGINYDFEVIKLESAGEAVAVVVPLPWGTPIPAHAVWREFHPTNGWFTFHTGNGNAIDSAPRRGGACPSPVATAWHTGLVPGYECVRLTIVDGGSNDLDGTADGVIRDPGTLAAPVSDGWVVNSSGGTGSMDILLLLSGALALLWRQRRALLLLVGLALPLSVRAHVEEGWYAGGMVGQARGSNDASDVEGRLADLGLTGGHVSVSNNRTAWRLFGGRQFDDTWSAELGYTNLGVVKTRITGYAEDPAPYLAHVNGVAPHSGKGPELSLMARHWLSEELFVYARGGLFIWEAQYDANLDRGGFANEPHSGRSPVLGIGGEYAARGPWSARAGWDRYRLAGEDIDVISVGVVYRFADTPAPTPAAPVITMPAPEPAPVMETPVELPAPAVLPTPSVALPPVPSAPVPAISWIVRYDFDGAGHVNYQEVITSLSDFLNTHPQARVELVGHTDSFGSKAYNARLSMRRAKGLRQELVKRGIDPRRITSVKGAGASQPVADNATDAGRALNRRTEINVYDGERAE